MPRTGLTQEELRSAALDAAEVAIRRFGIEKSTLIDVARQLGVSHSALYKLFPDKNSLMDSVSNRWLLNMESELESITNRKAAASKKIRAWFVRIHQLIRKRALNDPELFSAFEQAATNARSFIERHVQVTQNQLERLVGEGITSVEFRKGNVKIIARILFDATLSFHHPTFVFENVDQDRIPELRKLLDLLLDGLAKQF